MENNKERIIQFIKQKGPVLPVEVAKSVGSNIIMASALLSELCSTKQIKISHLKVGGSPLYYLPGQEAELQKFSDNLHEREKEAYLLLKENKVLDDSKLEPAIRVAIRNLRDFAIPLEVNYKDKKGLFWKWYLLTNKEVEELIKVLFGEKKTKFEKNKNEVETFEQKKIESKRIDNNRFLDEVIKYLNKNKMDILSKDIIKKNEIDFIIQIPSAVGKLEYYCKAKNKKRINDGDLASAFIQGQQKKLPVLFLTSGELTKKARSMLEKEFKGMYVKRI